LLLAGARPLWCHGQQDRDSVPPPSTAVDASIRGLRADFIPLIAAAQQRFQIPAISLTVVRRDQTLWSEGFGDADRKQGRRAGPDTIYRAGSLAKPMTALAVMQLAELGEIDIDQPLNGYLPEFTIRSRFDTTSEPIIVRSVLSHHAGLPTDLNKGMWTDQSFTEVAAQLGEEYTAFPPSLVFSYSNVGYTLLGHMVERVAGRAYADFMAAEIFGPLGMTHSAMGERPWMRPSLARGYRDGAELPVPPIRDLPAQGLHTSANDLGRFMRAILNGGQVDDRRLVDPGTLEQMVEPQNQDNHLDLDIVNGLGWFLEQDSIPGGGMVVRHGGTTLGFVSEMILLPQQGVGVAVLGNADGSRAILSRLLDAGAELLPAPLFLERLPQRPASHPAVEAAGDYATDFGLISIRPKDAKLCACLVEETVDLIPYPNGWLGLGQNAGGALPPALRSLATMRFQTQAIDGKEVVVAKHGDRQIILGEKVPETPIPASWLRRVGDYELLNPDPEFPLEDPKLKLREGHLCMSYRMPLLSADTIQVPLRPISATEAIVLGLGRTRGETLRAITIDGEERLRYSGFVGRQRRPVQVAPVH
jgi:CubicO group peptidase (beta-lactamase class C family)